MKSVKHRQNKGHITLCFKISVIWTTAH